MEKYFAAMDIFVLPSYREGFGMSVVEASAMGVPVIATKYPGPSGGMVDGVTGIAVDIQDVDGLEQAIRELLTDLDKALKMGAAGRKYVIESFDYEIFKKKYVENRLELLHIGS